MLTSLREGGASKESSDGGGDREGERGLRKGLVSVLCHPSHP